MDELRLAVEGLAESAKARALWVRPRLLTWHGDVPITPDAPIWDKVERCVRQGKGVKTKQLGGTGGGPYELMPKEGGVLIGINIRHWGGHVRQLRPIFLTRQGRVEGPVWGHSDGDSLRICAEPGYAVAGADLRADDLVRGIHPTFHELMPNGLKPRHPYAWGWSASERRPVELFNEGRPIIGLFGRVGDGLDAIGLIFGPK